MKIPRMENPYQPTKQVPRLNPPSSGPRWAALLMSIVSGVIGLVFATFILISYLFASMIGPQITGQEQTRLIANRLLFMDGQAAGVIGITIFLLLANVCLTSCVAHMSCAIFQRPNWQWCLGIAGLGGISLTALMLGWLWMLAM